MAKDWAITELKQKIEDDILDENARKRILKIFANVIKKTHNLNPSNWNISFRTGGSGLRFQLNVGHTYILGLYKDCIIVMCEKESFFSLSQDFQNKLSSESSETEIIEKDGILKICGEKCIQVKIPFSKCEEYLETLEPAICDFAKWCTENRKLNPESEEAHVSAFIDYLNQELETNIPQPEYEGEWNPDIEEQLKLYKDFQTEFPIAKIRNLTLKEYNNTERKNAFCYWIETRLRKLGSIQGSTSYKFGIYEYNDDPRENNGYLYDENYAWLTKYGKTSDEAYKKVHSNIIDIIEAAQNGNLDEIEKIDISSMFKWKIAFLYSNLSLINIFSKEALVYLANKYGLESADKAPRCELYQFLISKKGSEEHILKYSARIWNEWVKSKTNYKGDTQMTQEDTLLKKYANLLKNTKNLILTGAPGTGKTYLAKQIAKELGCKDDNIGFVQFHPSYDYTDFVEGLRPTDKDGNGNVGFERRDGVFKKFCEKAILPSSVTEDIQKELNENPTIWKVSLERTGDNPTRTDCLKNGYIRLGWSNYGDVADFSNFSGYTEVGGSVVLVAFQSKMKVGDIVLSCYSATEIDAVGIVTGDYEYRPEGGDYPRYRTVKWIVKGIKENIVEKNHGKTLTLASVYKLSVSIKDVFDIVEKYSTNQTLSSDSQEKTSNSPYVFIIDEINRGEVAKIFGELFYCVDPGYRGKEGKINTQYQNLIKENNIFYSGFFIPENVYIIGTMNDIDRSVESMDFAFRRRFTWAEVKAKHTQYMLDAELDAVLADEAKRRMDNLNAAIWSWDETKKESKGIDGLNEAYHIGASYFLKLKNYGGNQDERFESLWEYHIKGILQEYLRGNPNGKLDDLKAAYDREEEKKDGE